MIGNSLNIKFSKNIATYSQIRQYMYDCSNDFNPPYLSEVGNIDLYLNRILSYAERFEVYRGGTYWVNVSLF